MIKVVVITPTVGTKYLAQCKDSVREQTLRCEHYIVNDGKADFSCGGDHIINLPENTGRADGLLWNGHRIYAGMPFMVNADYVFFLDEDNWFEPNHVNDMVAYCEMNDLDWCYSLRKIVNEEGAYVCNDDCESLGMWSAFYDDKFKFIDTNCFCVKGSVLPKVSPAFNVPAIGDRPFATALMELYPNYGCTGEYTVNYRARPDLITMFKKGNKIMEERNKPLPWRKEKPTEVEYKEVEKNNFGANLFIATPMYGGMCAGYYAQSCLQLSTLLNQEGIGSSFSFMFNESLITRARNGLAKAFIKSDCTHLMFIDADIHFNPAAILKMIEADKDIICGIYPKKEIFWEGVEQAVKNGVATVDLKRYTGSFVVNLVDYQGSVTVPLGEPVEIFNGGTGFMLIKRNVFEQLKGKVPTYTNDVADLGKQIGGEIIDEYFATSIEEGTNRLLSEDYHFCKTWRDNGGKVYAAPWAELSHIGTYAFDGRLTPAP